LALIGIDFSAEGRPPGAFGEIREHTYRNVLAFISGRRPLEELDRFAEELDERGLQGALETLERAELALRSRPSLVR